MAIISDLKTSWDLFSLFSEDTDPKLTVSRKKVEEESYKFINKWKDRQDYLKDPKVLVEALGEFEHWEHFYGIEGDEGYYFWLRTQQDQNDPDLKAGLNKVEDFGKKISNDIQFFSLRLAKIPPPSQKKFLRDPLLAPYKHYLERLSAQSAHLLSEPEEKILTLTSTTAYANWIRMLESLLSKEEREIPLEDGTRSIKNFEEILTLAQFSPRKEVRDQAATAFNNILASNLDIAEHEFNSVLADKKIEDDLRHFTRPDASRHLADDIDTSVVDALVKAVSDNFSLPRRFYALKAKLLGFSKLAYHERNLSYGQINKDYPFPEVVNLVLKVFQHLDTDFADIFRDFVTTGKVDAFPHKNKHSGAFCAHVLLSEPTYILLNHTNKLHDVLTIAHESGHGINNELMRKKQNALNFGTPTSTAEVASTFTEDFVFQQLLLEADEDLRLSLMMEKLNQDVSSIFRQVAFYIFETELHTKFREKGYLSQKDIGEIFQRQMIAYMGEAVSQDPGSENWWVYVSHFRHFFYVYSYASGLLISKSLQAGVKQDKKYTSKVKDFLSAGLSDSPKNIFQNLGIDITDKTFWSRGLSEVKSLLDDTEVLARKLGKI